MQGGQYSQVASADYTVTGATQHFRAAITGAAALLSTFVALPRFTPKGSQRSQLPSAVLLSQEAASTGAVYVTWDGQAVPTAGGTLGFQVPVAPNFMRIPGRDIIPIISVIASTGTQNLQCYFEP